ncbi:MAG: FAD:protein FMN transferase [Alphaproteobacteria bacterium]|nr:FAD:protein FMN transferase [Alphaproteobacteria bacterium]
MKFFNYIFILLIILVLGFVVFTKHKPFQVISGKTMGTYYNIKIRTDQEDNLLNNNVKKILDDVISKTSMFDAQSELSKINADETGDWIELSADLSKVLKKAKEIYESSDGRFDPTVGKLVDLWGFGTSKSVKAPSPEEIKAVLKYTGFNKLKFTSDFAKVKKLDPRIYLDLSAIAKGYGVDRVDEYLTSEGYEDYIIEIGGEVRAKGMKNKDHSWLVGVMKPLKGKYENAFVLKLKDYSTATSGDYRNFYDFDGNVYSHTIDPKTGYPIKNNITSVTIFRKNCMEADALATALIAMPVEKALAFANEKSIIAIIFVRKQDNQFKILFSDKAKSFVEKYELKQVED